MNRNIILILFSFINFLPLFSQYSITEKEIKKSGNYFYETVLNPSEESAGKELAQKKLLKSTEVTAAISIGKFFDKTDIQYFVKKEEHLLKIVAYIPKEGSVKKAVPQNLITESDLSNNLKSVFLEKEYSKIIEKLEKFKKSGDMDYALDDVEIQELFNWFIIVIDDKNKVTYVLDKGEDSRKNLIDGKQIEKSKYENESNKIFIFEF
jgi:hypothetical protein